MSIPKRTIRAATAPLNNNRPAGTNPQNPEATSAESKPKTEAGGEAESQENESPKSIIAQIGQQFIEDHNPKTRTESQLAVNTKLDKQISSLFGNGRRLRTYNDSNSNGRTDRTGDASTSSSNIVNSGGPYTVPDIRNRPGATRLPDLTEEMYASGLPNAYQGGSQVPPVGFGGFAGPGGYTGLDNLLGKPPKKPPSENNSDKDKDKDKDKTNNTNDKSPPQPQPNPTKSMVNKFKEKFEDKDIRKNIKNNIKALEGKEYTDSANALKELKGALKDGDPKLIEQKISKFKEAFKEETEADEELNNKDLEELLMNTEKIDSLGNNISKIFTNSFTIDKLFS